MRLKLFGIIAILALSACGGGGGSSSTPSAPGPVATVAPPKSVSGDMMALSASRGWNYQTSSGGGVTVSTYVNPKQVSNGTFVFVASAIQGLVPTVFTDSASASRNAAGALGIVLQSDGYHVNSEISAGSSGVVPGTPLLIANNLVSGAVSNPYFGVMETVVNVGQQPGESACSSATIDGALVQYSVSNVGTYLISFVPGCGITQLVAPSGATFTLKSTSLYNLGNLSEARRLESVDLKTTILSIFGQGKNIFPGASLIKL